MKLVALGTSLIFFNSIVIACSQNSSVSDIATLNVPPSTFADGGTIMIFAHQDDDLLWMLPFWNYSQAFLLSGIPSTPLHAQVVANHPAYYKTKYQALWGSLSLADFIRDWKTDMVARQRLISVDIIKSKIEPFFQKSTTKRIVTHNNWGEYGHFHHRLVNQAVRELAIKYKKDVWANSVLVSMYNDTYTNVSVNNLGMDYASMSYNAQTFLNTRQLYLNQDASTGTQLITWTWLPGQNSYPTGSRNFVKLVNAGTDVSSPNNQTVTNTLSELSSYSGPWDYGSLMGMVLVRNNYCGMPNVAPYNGRLNSPPSPVMPD